MSVERTGTTAELMDLMPCAVALLRLYGCRNEAEFAELTGNSFRGMVLPDDYRPLSVMTQEISGPLLTGKDVLLDYRYISFCIRTRQGRVLHVEGSVRLNCCRDGSIWSVLLVDPYALHGYGARCPDILYKGGGTGQSRYAGWGIGLEGGHLPQSDEFQALQRFLRD